MNNKSCILTVIKNEHEYLDEWIRYHLNLGINHIFIFEDIDSNSHLDICAKYENISLDKISSILNESDNNKAKCLKTQKNINVQDLYFKNGLNYIKNNYDYDWCFIIDNDEFISLANNSLNDTLSLYKDYDAFVMSWECYGANELISKPIYDINKGLINTYTTKMKGFVNNNPIFHVKTCYNMKTFNVSFYKTNHQPSDFCKWCRTDYSNDRKKEIFDNIFIKHYITKSWQEYVEKKQKRGYFVGISRTNDFFFNVNPDMLYMKDRLMEVFNKETLVILPYKQSSSQGKELELCLSLWRKFCTFNYRFIVVGEFDKQFINKFPWVEFIECKSLDKIEGQYTPHLDILHKFEYALDKYINQYKGFIAMCDDLYAIKQFSLYDILQTHYHSNSFTGVESLPSYYWKHDKFKTRQLLDKLNLQHMNYTTHFPYWFEISKLKEIWDKLDMRKQSYVLEDTYFNYFRHEPPILDDNIRIGVWNKDIYNNKFKNAINDPNIKFACNSVEGWSKELENSLEQIAKGSN